MVSTVKLFYCQHQHAKLLCGLVFVSFYGAFAAPLHVTDLASSTAWTASVDGGGARSIVVPGAGWNSDQQNPSISNSVDNVLYQRTIAVPNVTPNQVVKILFGSVNHGAEVYINNNLVTTHLGPNMPFEADITPWVTPGSSYTLKVKAYSYRGHYKDGIPIGAMTSWFPQGIVKFVRMEIFPPIYIKSVFVKPSVTTKQLVYEIVVHNGSGASASLTLDGVLSSWNKSPWIYPTIPVKGVAVQAGKDAKIIVNGIPWNLGPQSYWWPNIPFRENYVTQLHLLALSLKANGVVADSLTQRFGFVEWGEGPYYYTVNGVRIGSQPSNGSHENVTGYDCYSTCPAFLPPKGTFKGCAETWKRFMRLGINTNRLHSSTPTEYMLKTADEVGFMLIPEAPARGWDQKVYDSVSFTQSERDLALTCRNSPSVAAYSIANESNAFMKPNQFGQLIDAIVSVDSTRPIIAEDDRTGPGKYTGNRTSAHAWRSAHYYDYRTFPSRDMITMLGEYSTANTSCCKMPHPCTSRILAREGDLGLDMRLRDVASWAIWHVIGWWPNLLEGMNSSLGGKGWSNQYGKDRADGVDGWGSAEVTFIQRSLDPYIIVDKDVQKDNICFSDPWPTAVPGYASGATITRNLEVFNGGFFGDSMNVVWEARWDSAGGKLSATGTTGMFAVQPGFHVSKTIALKTPATTATIDTIPIINGTVMYKEDRVYFSVNNRKLYVIYKSILRTIQTAPLKLRHSDKATIMYSQLISGSNLVVPAGKYRFQIVDAQGKIVLRGSGVGPRMIPISNMGSGMRIINLKTGKLDLREKVLWNGKFVDKYFP